MLIYKEPIKTYYISDIFDKYNINTKKINNGIINYLNKKVTQDEFLQINNVFINDFDNFSKAMKKK